MPEMPDFPLGNPAPAPSWGCSATHRGWQRVTHTTVPAQPPRCGATHHRVLVFLHYHNVPGDFDDFQLHRNP